MRAVEASLALMRAVAVSLALGRAVAVSLALGRAVAVSLAQGSAVASLAKCWSEKKEIITFKTQLNEGRKLRYFQSFKSHSNCFI